LERTCERIEYLCRSIYRDICDTSALQDAQAEGAYCHGRITEDVPGMRIDHLAAQGMLLRMWQVIASGSKSLMRSARNVESAIRHLW
jgi:hypothetical protein